MKVKTSSPMILPVVLATAVLMGCATRASYGDLYGLPALVSGADSRIVITPGTKYVNVEGGRTVAFIVGDRQFAWNFFVGRTVTNFALNDVAPRGILNHPVQAYVSPDPRYVGD
ncbi:MAG: hypothetical protein JWQ21_3991 [Herminiimonas sp.]|nr:hypothetical protein [Herminiimonas sp.]